MHEDPLDRLAHNLLNPLVIILQQIKQIETAFKECNEDMRPCPYAGREGSKCKKVNKNPRREK